MIYLETNCESIMLDMDTQEAYANLIEYYDRNKYPTEAQCRKILERMGTPERHTSLRCSDSGQRCASERRSTRKVAVSAFL